MGLNLAKSMLLFFLSIIIVMSPPTAAGGGEAIQLFDASVGEDGLPKGWQPLTFRKVERHTIYRLVEEAGRPTIQAESDRSASGIIRPFDLDPKVFQTLSWCWKVKGTISKGDASKKAGDDYAARIYVTFKFDPDKASFFEVAKFKTYKLFYGEYPPKGALNYIWANRMKKGGSVPNAYTDRAMMIAVESGEEKVGKWVCEERNLYEDYEKLFGESPPNISGVAIMTDTDNTGESASAAYADLVLR
ncbi:MAG: DUF3047 domain-containing protein [Waddliaceae bacterium]